MLWDVWVVLTSCPFLQAKEHMDSLIAAISQRTEQLCRDIQAATQKKIIELRTYHNAVLLETMFHSTPVLTECVQVEVALQKSIAATKSAQELVGRDDFSVAAHKARVEAQLQVRTLYMYWALPTLTFV